MDEIAQRRAKALSSPTRVAIVEHLEAVQAPLGPGELAEMLGVHHTAVRQHVAVLVEAGLVAVETLPPVGRGRPRIVYRAVSSPNAYAELAATLAFAVEHGVSAREAGRVRGRSVGSDDDAIAALAAEADRLGFEPHLVPRRGGRIDLVLDACPFADTAAASPAAVCELHRGLAEGILERDEALMLEDLRAADPHRAGCRFVIRHTTK